MEKDEEKVEEVTTSSSDVYSTPIALGFEALADTASTSPSSPVVYGPLNYNENESSSTLVTLSKDVRDAVAVRGRCGLYNLGNTCFMNSGLQCLMSTIPLVKFMLGYCQACRVPDETLFGRFQKLFAKIWSGHFSIVHPKEFKQTLGMYHIQFQDYRQHDCQEFLALLLDSLHEHLNLKSQSTNQNTEAGPSSEKQPIAFEHNINNKALCTSSQASNEDENRVTDRSKNAATSHSSLTFDNTKDTNVSQTCKLFSSEIKSSEKQKSGPCNSIAGFTVNLISEDSNHSSVSEQSSDSDQCSVMKNLKLRSSPTGCQSTGVLSSRVMNKFDEKLCDVSSTDDVNVGKNVELDNEKGENVVDCALAEAEGFRRVQSLQDFRMEDDKPANVIAKASSDIDLVSKDIGDGDEQNDFDNEVKVIEKKSEFKRKDRSFLSKPNGDYEEQTVMSGCSVRGSRSAPMVLNNAIPITSVPSLDDIYAKETKTLNTNVLADYMDETVTTDSEKFSKHDNTGDRSDVIEEEDIINNVMEVTTKPDGIEPPKKIKDVNIRADKKSKSPKGACGSNSEKEDCFSLDSVKRMKFEGTEKNLQMQEICKIQKERFLSDICQETKPKNVERVEKSPCTSTREATPSVDSDVESDMIDDQEDGNEMETSDDNEADGVKLQGRSPLTLAEGASYTTSEVLAAEEAWQKYLKSNDSVIVQTFQGQFKSTVVCAECNRLSVTFEPFMYLSVPVPHAMERQLCITYISLKSEPTQLLLELHKQDKILRVKQEICNLIGGDPCDIIIAEVLDWHISRILEDNTMLRYINDTSRKIYAFEVDQSTVGNIEDLDQLSRQSDATPAGSQDSMVAQPDVFSNMGTFSVCNSMTYQSRNISGTTSYYDDTRPTDFTEEPSTEAMVGTAMWEWNTGPTEKRRGSLETEFEENLADSTSGNGFSIEEDLAKAESLQSDNTVDKPAVSSSTKGGVTDDWKSCAICLEEMPENELMVHTTCGGTFCSSCLEMSAQHYRDTVYCCPVCSTPADMTEDFVPLTNAANHKPKTRIVAIPISYRCEHDSSGADNPFLFAHPSLLNLPSNLTGQHIYSWIQMLKPDLQQFKILLTDGTGLHCSRCLYMEHCSGCEIPQDGEAILRPGDHLTVSVASVTEEQIAVHQCVACHQSMDKQRSNEPITLLDCFRAFTQSEDLDEHNPWFCPHCKENRRAKKTMTVWQYPDTLIVQLKRFVFHELSSTKVDSKVIFPLDDLDLNSFISGPKSKNLMYNLYSLVCHFGGANSGHYTAYAKHPVDGRWYYYNDETVTESCPGQEEFVSTYVLFYQRKGTDKALQIPDDFELTYEVEDTGHVTTSGTPSVHFQPPEGEITLDINNTTPSSSHLLLPSSGTCDVFGSSDSEQKRQSAKEDKDKLINLADSSCVRAELVEADSTELKYEFYT